IGTTDASYAPPGWDDYQFGVYTPWWWFGDFARGAADYACWDCGGTAVTYEEFTGRTDGEGSHYLDIAFGQATGTDGEPRDVDLPRTVTAEATVYDVNRQAWSDRTDLLVHPAEVYVGVRSDRSFVTEGSPIRIDAVVTDVDGDVA